MHNLFTLAITRCVFKLEILKGYVNSSVF